MKVAFIFSPQIVIRDINTSAGSERVFMEDLIFFRKRGYIVESYARIRYENNLNIHPLPHFDFLRKISSFFRSHQFILFGFLHNFTNCTINALYLLYLYSILRRFDIVIAHAFPESALLFPKKTIIVMGALWDLPLIWLFSKRYTNAYFAFSSKFLMQQHNSKYPTINFRQCVLYNAIDKQKFHVPYKYLLTHSNKIRLLFASAWVPEKGLHILLDALLALPFQIRNKFSLTIASPENFWFSGYKNAYLSYENTIKEKMRLFKNLKILGGVSHAKMPSVYLKHDFLLFPSTWGEPFGLVVLEAIACGLRVVGFNVGALPEILSLNNSILTHQKNKEGMISLLEDLIKIRNLKIHRKSLLTFKNRSMTNEFRFKNYMKIINCIHAKKSACCLA